MTHREIKTSNPATEGLRIRVMDGPGPGGAPHEYLIEVRDGRASWMINFQNGPIGEAGVNGLTHEALIAVVMDRLDCFQKGDYACKENAEAFHHLDQALGWLSSRTRRRVEQGVEGTMALDPPEEGDHQGEPHAPPTAEPHEEKADRPMTTAEADAAVRKAAGIGKKSKS